MALDRIFVFGSNLAGKHGAGAALAAKLRWKAEYGVGKGPTGLAYAIPTKDSKLNPLPLWLIEEYVEDFQLYAANHMDDTFLVTRVGCGLAGNLDTEIAPMFVGSTENCHFDEKWAKFLGSSYKYFAWP